MAAMAGAIPEEDCDKFVADSGIMQQFTVDLAFKIQIMINENVAIFEKLLETKREELIAERLTMTEVKFATQYKISTVRVIEFL